MQYSCLAKRVALLSDDVELLEEARQAVDFINKLEGVSDVLVKKQTEALKQNELTPHVMSVPGVGAETAMAFLAFIGDGSRFTRGAEVSNYIGLVPRVDISGDTVHYGRINKKHGCSLIRRVLINAAWALVRSKNGGALAEKYNALQERIGKKKAIVAIARKMGELLWIIYPQSSGSPHHEPTRK